MSKVKDFLEDNDNNRKIRYVGFSMGAVGMVVGVLAAITAGAIGSGGLGFCAAAVFVMSFVLLPVTSINFTKPGYY